MFSFCGFCSNLPAAGQYAYQAFNKNKKNNKNQNLPNNISNASLVAKQSNLQTIIKDNPNDVIKKVLKSNYTQLIKKHQQSKEKFTDLQFPPNQKSIGVSKQSYNVAQQATWKRIPQVIKNPQFISQSISPNDILQGKLGNCYFLSSVAALAENQYRVKNLFPTLQVNPYGIYMARIMYQGIIQQVVVDDYIPVTPQGTPLYANASGGKQIWVMILQKCWAKLHGSYEATVGGVPNQVLHALSGAPTFYHPIPQKKQDQDKLFQQMLKADQLNQLICCGTKGDQNLVEKYGLVSGHAYTILSVFLYPYKMLRIRNPWGKRQWNGKASDQDRYFWSRISPADKQKLGYSQKNDGTFFMLYEDFVNYFSLIDICKINDNANYVCVDAQFGRKTGQIFELTTDGEGTITLGISQNSLRGKQFDELSRTTMVISKYDSASKGYQYKYINSCSSKLFSDQYLQLQGLYPGKYIIFVKCHWIRQSPDKATLSAYSEAKCSLVQSKQSKHDKFLYKTFLDHARKNTNKHYLLKDPEQWVSSDLLLNKCGYGYIVVHLDQKSKRKIGIQLNENQFTSKRLVIKRPYKGQGTIKAMTQPGKQLIILFRLKSNTFPTSITLPTPKLYNLV